MIFNLSLRDGVDDTLIQHLESLPRATRSQWIRDQCYAALEQQPMLEQILDALQGLSTGAEAVSAPDKDPFFSDFGK